MKRIVVSVSNDLVTDQRVKKVCDTLHHAGFDILLIGRRFKNSLPVETAYRTHRFRLLFHRSFLFYAELNLRLFFKLLFTKKDILLANDLDTLLPNFLTARILRKKLVYDSHELFTEVPELRERPFVKKVWLAIEQFIFPKLKNVMTVNHIIADIYSKKYGVPVRVVRNISPKIKLPNVEESKMRQWKKGRKMLILQGAGINKDRGAEEAVAMMQYLDNVFLLIIGGGDVFDNLKKMRIDLGLEDKVLIMSRLPYIELLQYTQMADLGLSLDKGTNLNYEYSLPNKIFDYIRCEVPLFVSNRKIVAQLVRENEIGFVFTEHQPRLMAQQVTEIFADKERYQIYKKNLKQAASSFSWEEEAKTLLSFYENLE